MGRRLIALAFLALALLVAWQVGWLADLGPVSRGAPGTDPGTTLEARPAGEAASAARASLAGREGAKPAAPPSALSITGPRITGRVVDAARRGIAGARVISLPDLNTKTARFDEFGKEGAAGFAATADAEGRFVVAVSKDSPFHFVAASAPGFGLALKPELAPGADIVLVLEPARTQTGSSRTATGTPSSAPVSARSFSSTRSGSSSRRVRGRAARTGSRECRPSARTTRWGGSGSSRSAGSR